MENAGPSGQHGLDGAHRLPGVPHEEGHVAQLGHGRQELHVFGEATLVLEGAQVRLCLRHYAAVRWQQQTLRHLFKRK